uniref:putative receptor-like protein kinase At2g30940 n=1 Tax=Erigeron canadensis TaxID=72917 RepID=UPI001CB8DB25|nr:putative receptor-like protein kinase At2g30940 [Erigeron canadensis]
MRRNTVAIKRFHPMEDKWFYNEIEMLDTCKHPHIVRLLGFCVEGYEKILVVEHFSNRYLTEYWQNFNGKMPTLTWAQRLKICLDAANALNYLHNEMEDGQSNEDDNEDAIGKMEAEFAETHLS